METIYLSLSAQVVVGTFFMESPVVDKENLTLYLQKIINNLKHYITTKHFRI